MQIQWTGFGSFRIQTQQAVMITDPFSDSYGMTMPKLKADIVLVSDPGNTLTNNTKRLSGDFFLISGPGEYEIKQTFIYGVPTGSATVYMVENEGMSLAFLGALEKNLTEEQIEKLEDVDILLLPVGTLAKDLHSVIVSELEPRVVIPYLYKQPRVELKVGGLDVFLKEFGVKDAKAQEKYVTKKKDLPQGEMNVVVLAPTQA